MKKLLLSLATVALTGAFAMAESVTFDFVNNAYNLGERGGNDYVTTPATATSGDVTLTLDKTSGSGFRLWSDGLRIYKTGEGEATIAVSVPNANVTAIDMTVVKAYASVKVGDTDATWTSSSKTYSWTGTADAPVITIKTTNNSSIATLAITYSPKGSSSLESAGLSFPESLYTVLMGQEFTAPALTKATDAAATYTSSNEGVATVDAATGAVTILAAGTTVIKAATPATYNAGEASYTLKVVAAYNSIAEVYAAENVSGVINFPLTVAYQNDINTYAYDEAGNYTLIYGTNVGTRERGDIIPAGWEGKYSPYGGLPEIVPVTTPAESTENVDYTPAEVESVNADMMNHVVVLKKVTFAKDTPSSKSNFTGTAEDGTSYTFRNNFLLETVDAGIYNVELAVSTYNGNMQLYPTKYTTWESGVNEITVAEGEAQYYNMQGVRVANPENGMFIRVQNGKAQKVVIK